MQREMNKHSEKLSIVIEKIKNDKKALMIILLALTGMMLILFSDNETISKPPDEKENFTAMSGECEERLQKLISKIKGVGKVSVMITYESGEEKVFAYDKEESYENGEYITRNDYIVIDGDNGETGMKIKSVYPKIRGVAVVCSGASDPITKERVVSVVSALFDVSIKNISVVSAEN